MSFPEGTIHYAGDHVILAGDMTPDQVAACVAAGAKSWLYLNDDCHAKCPKADVQAASLPFECVPVMSPAALTPGVVDKLLDVMAASSKPLVIQCSTATRAGIPSSGQGARKLGAASALQAAAMDLSSRLAPSCARAWRGARAEETRCSASSSTRAAPPRHVPHRDGAAAAILIDPVLEMVDRDLRLCEELGVTLRYVLNTHCHADHITGSGAIKQKMPPCLPSSPRRPAPGRTSRCRTAARVSFGDLHVEVRRRPGTPPGACRMCSTTRCSRATRCSSADAGARTSRRAPAISCRRRARADLLPARGHRRVARAATTRDTGAARWARRSGSTRAQ